MSSLESKLTASMQSAKRRTGAPKGAEAEHPSEDGKPGEKKGLAADHASTDLNAGGGRERNPGRIWPD